MANQVFKVEDNNVAYDIGEQVEAGVYAVRVHDTNAITELQAAVAHLANVVSGIQGTLTVDTSDGAFALPASQVTTLTPPDNSAVLSDIKRSVTDYEVRLDYDVRTDSNPVYVGKASNASATSDGVWSVQKLSYDSDGRVERVQVLDGSIWDDRASLGW